MTSSAEEPAGCGSPLRPPGTIYKICPRSLWLEAVQGGEFRGAPVDLRDGFIHFSAAGQVTATYRKHFAELDPSDLLLISVPTARLGTALKWEVSRGGALFPHLYAALPVAAASRVVPLTTDAQGNVVLPEDN